MKLIFTILVVWFLIHYGIMGAFLTFCGNVFYMFAGIVS